MNGAHLAPRLAFVVAAVVLGSGCNPVTSTVASDAVTPGADPVAGVDSPRARLLRERLVSSLIARGDLHSGRVADAMRAVPRHALVPEAPLDDAYADTPLPIGYDQTISQPAVVAIMTEALELSGRERVLEVGTGSGYQAAVLSVLAKEVDTIELVAELARRSGKRLADLGYTNVHVRAGDGYLGWPERAPFDCIIVTAAPTAVPQTLLDQLADGGVLVAPVGESPSVQQLLRYRKQGGRLRVDDLGPVIFVPMVHPGSDPPDASRDSPAQTLDASPGLGDQTSAAVGLMMDFARRTGLTAEAPGRRYLWTDAFAELNFLGLARATGEDRYTELAVRLIDRVHGTLGKHRPDDCRTGWISGLDARHGEAHPTRGGLRIGKDLPERGAGEPFDEALEWERDGQYLHYLTKWMVALDQATRSTGNPAYNLWARELAETAHRAFSHGAGGARRRLYWKMSIDLSRPLVASMGQHDALDGYLTCVQLRATASGLPGSVGGPTLESETADFASMIDRENLETDDPLGLGGLLTDAYRIEQLAGRDSVQSGGLREALLAAALSGLERYTAHGDLEQPAQRRLAFRELGLAIGLAASTRLRRAAARDGGRSGGERDALEKLGAYEPLGAKVIAFWLEPEHRKASSWTEHRDINEVMLATALAPEGFLSIATRKPSL